MKLGILLIILKSNLALETDSDIWASIDIISLLFASLIMISVSILSCITIPKSPSPCHNGKVTIFKVLVGSLIFSDLNLISSLIAFSEIFQRAQPRQQPAYLPT